MRVLGFTLGHDSSIALIEEGRILAIWEAERFFRQKRYKLHCLSLEPGDHFSGFQYVRLDDLKFFLARVREYWGGEFDAVAVQNQGRKEEFENLRRLLADAGIQADRFVHVDHHVSHAALAFYTSPFRDAVILSYDGIGNDGHTLVFKGENSRIHRLHSEPTYFGYVYNNLGYIAGIRPDVAGSTAGKTMGLAAYGKVRPEWLPLARQYVQNYRKLPYQPFEGLNNYGKAHTINSIHLSEIAELKSYVTQKSLPQGLSLKDRVKSLAGMLNRSELRLPGPEHELSQDLVHTVQHAWTDLVIELLNKYTGASRNLCVVGGCALNGVTNFAIQERDLFKGYHFVPNPTDCGLSAGAALYAYYELTGQTFEGYPDTLHAYFGDEAFDRGDLPALKKQHPCVDIPPSEAPRILAQMIKEDRIVGLIRGRYEVGPRALGNRSILCNPLRFDMRDVLNQRVKHREWYRPFAPVVPAEDAQRYFTNVTEIPYMSVICFTRPEYRSELPSITHVDGSARLQTLRKDWNPFLHATLKEFEKLTGKPILLNTSFNPGGEPILNFYRVGLEMLKTTDLDCVLIESTLFGRPDRKELLERLPLG